MKWKFWEKDEALGDAPGAGSQFTPDSLNNPNLSNPSMGNEGFAPPKMTPEDSFDSLSKQDPFASNLQPSPQPDTVNHNFVQSAGSNNLEKDIMLVNAKLDTIKVTLENINHRIMKIERIAEGETQAKTTPNRPKVQETQYRW